MKVICINNGQLVNEANQIVFAPQLTEGKDYTVTYEDDVRYILLGVDAAIGHFGFSKKRFIPLSSIDETEITREYANQKVCS